jgi:hypothetical protein
LIRKLELPPEFRPRQKLVDVQFQLMGELPGNDLFKLLESTHAARTCNFRRPSEVPRIAKKHVEDTG